MTKGPARLEAVFREILAEARQNPEFATRLEKALTAVVSERRSGRRPPGRVDPFEALARGEDVLRARLAELSVEELKDVVAEHGMDHARLALRWRRPERLIELIVAETRARLAKGDAFRRS